MKFFLLLMARNLVSDRKILVFKKKRRKNYRRMNGHRQDITFLKVTSMDIPGIKAKSSSVEKKADVKDDTAVKTAPKKTAKKILNFSTFFLFLVDILCATHT